MLRSPLAVLLALLALAGSGKGLRERIPSASGMRAMRAMRMLRTPQPILQVARCLSHPLCCAAVLPPVRRRRPCRRPMPPPCLTRLLAGLAQRCHSSVYDFGALGSVASAACGETGSHFSTPRGAGKGRPLPRGCRRSLGGPVGCLPADAGIEDEEAQQTAFAPPLDLLQWVLNWRGSVCIPDGGHTPTAAPPALPLDTCHCCHARCLPCLPAAAVRREPQFSILQEAIDVSQPPQPPEHSGGTCMPSGAALALPAWEAGWVVRPHCGSPLVASVAVATSSRFAAHMHADAVAALPVEWPHPQTSQALSNY